MFRTWPLSKRFAVLSGPLLVGAGLLIATMNHVWFMASIERAAERNNVALARVLSNVVWPEFESDVLARQDSDEWRTSLTREIASLVRHTSVAKVKLYRSNGLMVYSTDPTDTPEKEDGEGFAAAIKGEVKSEVEFEDKINTFGRVTSDRHIVESYIPIYDADNPRKVVAVFEIYDDITGLLAQFRDAEARLGVFLASVLLFLYACLLTMVVRSEAIAKRHHEAKLRLADAAARADAASTAKSEFLANMSHELRTPLNAIVGFSEVMKHGLLGPVTPRPYAEYVRHIWVAASHLTDIIGNILDLSKIDAGKVTVEKSTVALPETILLVCGMMQDTASKRSITLIHDIDQGLDSMVTDPVKLRQILLNLLSNAVKFTPDGGQVMLQVGRVGDGIVFSVRDTGIGMDEGEIRIAMSPFGQIESPFSRMHEGTGLGLPLTQRLVGLIGGGMEISSEKGVGTVVRVILPADEHVPSPTMQLAPALQHVPAHAKAS
ncbi:sensor histidine kinase [Dongia deserti]|uniref:sensor histidine kinase n=1 Tax=Dongia deserti TaxID=2268030 RepID=UPI000E64FA0C|nr:HAMP domain-containing sensor histidine kinase [Dongia deserti]